MVSNSPLAKIESGPKIQLGEAAVPARPQGETAISGAWNQRKSEPTRFQCWAPEAPRFARRLRRSDLQ